MRQLFISGMHKVSVMPLHNWDHPLWGFVFNVIKNTSLLKKRRDCMLRFVCHLRLSPPSMMGNCNPFSVSDASSLRWLASIACHSSSSVCLLNGSRLSRRVPENNTGSCAETIRDSYKLNDPFAVSSEVKLECGHKALVGPGKKQIIKGKTGLNLKCVMTYNTTARSRAVTNRLTSIKLAVLLSWKDINLCMQLKLFLVLF